MLFKEENHETGEYKKREKVKEKERKKKDKRKIKVKRVQKIHTGKKKAQAGINNKKQSYCGGRREGR
jgi:hypothetical protein